MMRRGRNAPASTQSSWTAPADFENTCPHIIALAAASQRYAVTSLSIAFRGDSMARPTGEKRQAAQADLESEDGSRRTRSKITEEIGGNKRTSRSSDQSNGLTTASHHSAKKDTSPQATPKSKKRIEKKGIARPVKKNAKAKPPPAKVPRRRSPSFSRIAISNGKSHEEDDEDDDGIVSQEGDSSSDGPSYWLMKAEPESRLEKGKEVKFSIDDLMNADEPEAWDGIRNPRVARNNMRAMIKGDQVFFYHSNCKTPGIVGTMEIVGEHSVDESAFDEEHPYFDPKSTRTNPKWCVVHVEFRSKFHEMVTLKELQIYAKGGKVLENMQMLKLPRLSVSQVSRKEWDFIHTLTDPNGDRAVLAPAYKPTLTRTPS
ncbi:MAG: hypothetical protein Q9224_002197 [Gallowayella concinna]